jgi:hypothetical protein
MILNENYDFNREAPNDVKDAFKFPPAKVRLQTGQKLYRILTPAGIDQARNRSRSHSLESDPNEVGYWWMTSKTFRQLASMSRRQGVGLTEVVRAKEAIPLEYSSTMNALFIIQLKCEAYAFQGLAAPQPRSIKDRTVMLIGNAEQVWIPRLSWDDVFVVRFLNSFQSINLTDLGPNLTVTLGDILRAQRGG